MDEKKREMEPLQQALGKLRNANNAGRGSGLCSSEEELNNYVYFLLPMLCMLLNSSFVWTLVILDAFSYLTL